MSDTFAYRGARKKLVSTLCVAMSLKMKCVKFSENTPWCKRAQSIMGMSRDQGKRIFIDTNIKMTLSM